MLVMLMGLVMDIRILAAMSVSRTLTREVVEMADCHRGMESSDPLLHSATVQQVYLARVLNRSEVSMKRPI